MKTQKIELTVVGLQHHLTASTRKFVSEKLKAEGPVSCKLVREPSNPHDKNAIKVYISSGTYKNLRLGYLRRGVAAEWSPLLKSGKLEFVQGWLVSLDTEDNEAEILVEVAKVGKKSGNSRLKENP